MTYGQLRLVIQKENVGADLDLLDSYVQNRYTEILDQLPWKRQEAESVLQSPPSYAVGTVSASQGSNMITGTGTNWTTAMNGLMIRIANTSEFYQFTFVTPTSATIDRGYEGATASISTATLGSGGTGFVVGNQLWIPGGNGLASIVVLTTGAGGAILTFGFVNNGNNYAIASGVALTGGSGTGATLNITAVGASSLLPYRIDQAIFLLPPDCRILRSVKPLHDRGEPLEPITPHDLDILDPQRRLYGTPRYYCQTWDSFSSPPQMQVELSPIPSSPDSAGATLSFVADYVFEAAAIDPRATGTSLLPWVRPAALQAAVRADFLRLAKDWPGAEAMDERAKELVQAMLKINAAQRGPQQIRTAAQYQRVNANRRHNKWHRGYTG